MTQQSEDDTAGIGPSPARERQVSFRGETVKVSPLRVRQLPAFVGAMRPMLREIAAAARGGDDAVTVSADTLLDWIDRYTTNLVAGVAAATDLTPEAVADAQPDEFLELAAAVFAVNTDFFVRRLLPIGGRVVIDALRAIGSGPTRSTDSSAPAMPTSRS